MSEAPRRIGPDYREVIRLRDGTEVVLRLIGRDDKPLLVDGLRRMSPESRYRRFFTHRSALNPAELAYLTELDQETHVAIGAGVEQPDGTTVGLGVARFVRLPGEPCQAEAAIAVVDDVHGQGLGRELFKRLVVAARERGIEDFVCEVLPGNDAMLNLMQAFFPQVDVSEESDVVVLTAPLPREVGIDSPEHSPTGPLYRLLGLTASGVVQLLRHVRSWPVPPDVLRDLLDELDDDEADVAVRGPD